MIFQLTKEEIKLLKELSSITELSKIITIKTNQEFSIVPSKMVKDLNSRLIGNILYIHKLNDFFFNNWSELIKVNQEVTKKWEYELNIFRNDAN